MRIDILTVVPELLTSPLNESILHRAQEKGLVRIVVHNLHDYAHDRRKTTDDYPFGGEAGMVLKCEPVFELVEKLQSERHYDEIIYTSPDGVRYDQHEANRLSTLDNIIILCGHYKGIDHRIREHLVTREISIGDYVLTGGETAAMVVLFLLRLDSGSEKYSQLARSMKEAPHADNFYEPRHDAILQMTAKILTPIVILLGIYVVLNGHLSPGGGFSGGAIMGAGLMIYVTAFGFKDIRRFFTYKTYQRVVLCSLLTYAASKCYSFYTGANDIHSIIPLGTPGAILSSGLILVLNICVGFIVTCTMYAFYAVFRKGEV